MIRRAEWKDRAQIFKLWKGLVAAEAGTGLIYPRPLEPKEAFSKWITEFTNALGNAGTLFLVDEIDGKIAGFVVGYINNRSFGHPKLYMEISEMYVDPTKRGPSGFRLLRAITKAASRVGCETLECGALTTPKQTAQTLRAGWTPYLTRYYKKVRK